MTVLGKKLGARIFLLFTWLGFLLNWWLLENSLHKHFGEQMTGSIPDCSKAPPPLKPQIMLHFSKGSARANVVI